MPLYGEPVFQNHGFFAGRWPVKEMGLSWRTVQPSQIESTSAPGFLLKLRSGRLALVSNDKAGRANLLLAFSEDDGKTWTKPVVLARQKDGQLSYRDGVGVMSIEGKMEASNGFSYSPVRINPRDYPELHLKMG